MKPPKLILDHVSDPSSFAYHENKLTNLTKAMAVSMLATGMSRLDTNDEFLEFFTRMAIFYREEGIIESYFAGDELFCFLFDGAKVKATPSRIMEYKGVQLDSGAPNIPFNEWLNNINHIYLVLKVMQLKRNSGQENFTYLELLEYYAPTIELVITEDHIKDARLMAGLIMSDLC